MQTKILLSEKWTLPLFIVPAAVVFVAFWLLPVASLIVTSGEGPHGFATYWDVLTTSRYEMSIFLTTLLSLGITVITLAASAIAALFLVRNSFLGRGLLVSVLTLPLAFPGVVIGFMIIMLGGRQGLVGTLSQWATGDRLVFAYSFAGLFVGYVYFSVPRVILTLMAACEKLDLQLEEAARSLGAGTWRVTCDVILPALMPALISTGAICFATSMGAFGTAFTLNAGIDVLPMLIYNEFTLNANVAVASALSVILGLVTWLALMAARSATGAGFAAAG
jgi:putative spermidine/putrescine transport system permease protein